MKHNVKRIVEYSKTFLRQCKLYHFHDTSSSSGFKSFQFMISDNTTNASGCNPISGSSSTMVAGRKSLGCKNSVAIQIKRAVPSDKVCAEKPKLLRSLTCCLERFGKDKQEALKAWLENYQMGTTWEEGLIGGLPK
jgi:hypothetical protein